MWEQVQLLEQKVKHMQTTHEKKLAQVQADSLSELSELKHLLQKEQIKAQQSTRVEVLEQEIAELKEAHRAEIENFRIENDQQFAQMQTEVQTSQSQNTMIGQMQKKLLGELKNKLKEAQRAKAEQNNDFVKVSGRVNELSSEIAAQRDQ